MSKTWRRMTSKATPRMMLGMTSGSMIAPMTGPVARQAVARHGHGAEQAEGGAEHRDADADHDAVLQRVQQLRVVRQLRDRRER